MNAQTPALLSVTVRVTRIRSRNSKGCIVFGHRVDLDAGLNDRSTAIVIAVPTSVVTRSMVEVGGIYEVYGEPRGASSTEATGFPRFKWMRRISVSYDQAEASSFSGWPTTHLALAK